MIWDFIIVGGGLAGSVISNRLHGTLPQANILVVEAGLNANNDQGILYPNGTGSLSPYIWYIETPPQPFLNGRKIGMGQGTGLGGGTVVNGGKFDISIAVKYIADKSTPPSDLDSR